MSDKPKQSLPFPLKGLHESVGFDVQPLGTTTDALNVRAFCSLSGRARGGSRPGTDKYAYAPVTPLRVPVQNLCKAVQGAAYTPAFTPVSEDWQGYDAEVQPNLAPLWGMASILDEDNPVLAVYPDTWETTANGLAWRKSDYGGSSSFLAHFIPMMNDVEPDVRVVLRAKPDITSGTGSFGGADEPTWVGPFIRASTDFKNGYFACLEPANATTNAVTFKLHPMNPVGSSGYATLATTTITLGGGSSVTTDCSIRIWVARETGVSSIIKARIQWPGGGVAGADIDEIIQYTDTDTTDGLNVTYGQQGGGVGIFNPNTSIGSDPSFTEGTAFRTIDSVITRRRIPPTRPIVAEWNATDDGDRRYYRPEGIVNVEDSRDSGTDPSRFTIGADGYDNAASSGYVVDTDNDVFIDSGGGIPRDLVALARPWDSGGPHDIEVDMSIPADMGAGDTGYLSYIFRASTTTGNFVGVNVFTTIDTTDSRGKSGRIYQIQVSVQNGDDTLLNNAAPLTSTAVFVEGSVLRVEDHTDSIGVYLDGRLLATVEGPVVAQFGSSVEIELPADTEDSYALFSAYTNVGVGNRNIASAIRWVRRGGSTYNATGSTTSGRLLAVSGGTIADITGGLVTPIPSGSSVLNDGTYDIQAAAAFNSVFYTDGESIKEYSLSTGLVATPTATGGSFPTGARLVCLYHGCLAWSGTYDDPHNWFISETGNPYGYDYSPPTPSETQAVAGNNSVAGLIGDVINGLVPIGDDYLTFICDHSIWQMEGHPAAGGIISLVSDKVGGAFGCAWAKDPANNMYFWGNDGIYKLAVGGRPENLTKGRIDLRLRDVALDQSRISMAWNYLDAELVVLIGPSDPTAAVRVIVWESRTNAWWEDVYPVEHGPTCLLAYDSTAENDQAFLLGGRDGYVRKVSRTIGTDDSLPIPSRVRFAPYLAPDRASSVMLNTIHPVLANGSAVVNVNVYTGQTAEGCATAVAPRASVTLAHAGRNGLIHRPVRGYAVQVELAQPAGEARWALESLGVEFDPAGMPARHARTSSEGATGGD